MPFINNLVRKAEYDTRYTEFWTTRQENRDQLHGCDRGLRSLSLWV